MMTKKNLNTVLKGVIAAVPAIPYLMPKKTPIGAYIVGGIGFAVAGGLAALFFFSPKTRTKALTAAKDGYNKVSDQISHLKPVIGLADGAVKNEELSNGFGGHSEYSSTTGPLSSLRAPVREPRARPRCARAKTLNGICPPTIESNFTMSSSQRMSSSLLSELYELEEDAYRLAIREAKRIGSGPPAAALRAVAGHASAALDELYAIAKERHVRLGSLGAIAVDTMHRLRDIAVDPFVDHEHAYRRALTALHRTIDLVRVPKRRQRKKATTGSRTGASTGSRHERSSSRRRPSSSPGSAVIRFFSTNAA